MTSMCTQKLIPQIPDVQSRSQAGLEVCPVSVPPTEL